MQSSHTNLPPFHFIILPQITQPAGHPTEVDEVVRGSVPVYAGIGIPRRQVSRKHVSEAGSAWAFPGTQGMVQENVTYVLRVTGKYVEGWCQVYYCPDSLSTFAPSTVRVQVLLSNNSRVPIPVDTSIPYPFGGAYAWL
jgi:hypothetical protein